MAVVRTLGKNTLGDNDKMKVAQSDHEEHFQSQHLFHRILVF